MAYCEETSLYVWLNTTTGVSESEQGGGSVVNQLGMYLFPACAVLTAARIPNRDPQYRNEIMWVVKPQWRAESPKLVWLVTPCRLLVRTGGGGQPDP